MKTEKPIHEVAIPRSVSLTKSDVATAFLIGDGNVSRGVKRAIAAARILPRLQGFARAIIAEHQLETEGIQELLVEYGLIVPVEVTEPCSPNCRCEYYDAEFPTTCYAVNREMIPRLGAVND